MLCYFLKKSEAHLGIQYNNHFNPFHIFCFSGEAKEWEIEEAFLSAFQLCENKGQVTYAVYQLFCYWTHHIPFFLKFFKLRHMEIILMSRQLIPKWCAQKILDQCGLTGIWIYFFYHNDIWWLFQVWNSIFSLKRKGTLALQEFPLIHHQMNHAVQLLWFIIFLNT